MTLRPQPASPLHSSKLRFSKELPASILLQLYKRVVSPLLHTLTGGMGACRFQPTCSEYAAVAISARGLVRGSLLTFGRLLRCTPLCAGGFDPVPRTYVKADAMPPR